MTASDDKIDIKTLIFECRIIFESATMALSGLAGSPEAHSVAGQLNMIGKMLAKASVALDAVDARTAALPER